MLTIAVEGFKIVAHETMFTLKRHHRKKNALCSSILGREAGFPFKWGISLNINLSSAQGLNSIFVVRGPLSAGLLLPLQLADALPGEPLGVALPEPVEHRAVAAHRLPAVQEEVLPQDMNNILTSTAAWLIPVITHFCLRLVFPH